MMGASTALSVNSGNSLRLYEKRREIRREQLELLWEILKVKLIEFQANVDHVLGAARNLASLRLGNLAPAHQRFLLANAEPSVGTKSAAFSRKRKEIGRGDRGVGTRRPGWRRSFQAAGSALTQVRSWSPKGKEGTS
jgi:hypothetical protein